MFTTLLLTAAIAPQAVQLAPIPPRPARRVTIPARQQPGGVGGSAAAMGGSSTPAGPNTDRPAQRPVPPNDYEVSTFGYTDPFAPDFNVLGGGSFSVLREDESFLIPFSGTMGGVRREGPGYYTTSGSMNHSGSGSSAPYEVRDAGMGDFFGDGKERVVTASYYNNPFSSENYRHLCLRIWESDGQPFLIPIREVFTDFAVTDVMDLDCGDVDGDGLDEIVISVQRVSTGDTRVMVFDDAVNADWTSGAPLAPIVDRLGYTIHAPVLVACAEFDGDAAEEVVMMSPRTYQHFVHVFDDARWDLDLLDYMFHDVAGSAGTTEGTYVVPFDFDGDGIDEIASYWKERLFVARFDPSTNNVFRFGDSRSIDSDAPISLTAVDEDGNGREQLRFLDSVRTPATFGFDRFDIEIDALELRANGTWAGSNLYTVDLGFDEVFDTQLVALDDDKDGREELRAVAGTMTFGSTNPEIVEFNYDGSTAQYLVTRDVGWDFVRGERRLFQVAGDDDGESVVVRWTGEKYLNLSKPIPIVLMEAVPTKEGISQQYQLSGSSFTQSASGSTSFSTVVGNSVSASVGVSTPDLVEDLFGASASTTIDEQITRTTGSETSIRSFVTNFASYDAHTIVFQGTLYMSYVYEIVRALPGAGNVAGELITINVPVSTGAWQWELDFFNQVFQQDPIDPAIAFGHSAGATVIGDPSSYVERSELEGYVSGSSAPFDGWASAVGVNVPQGTGAVEAGVEMSQQQTTTEQRTVSVETTAGVQIGPYSMDGSAGLSTGEIYSVTTGTSTTYAGKIGGIASSSQWQDWAYEAGLVIYQERSSFFAPVQVMRYWVNPFGTAYP